ncbi:MAG: bifunctional nicotinamide-nucleotide adenylyltransferase/Nudix hydroxylase [Pseudomonadota bacterium]
MSKSIQNADNRFDYLVFIGRFQPFHRGHASVVYEALRQSDKLIVLVGSSNRPRSPRNPWTFQERRNMILQGLPAELHPRLHVRSLADACYDDLRWQENVCTAVTAITGPADVRVGIIGHCKDQTSYYLRLFPEWPLLQVEDSSQISATPIREQFFEQGVVRTEDVAVGVAACMRASRSCAEMSAVGAEMAAAQRYRSRWQHTPYPPAFVTVDAVVVHYDQILLIQRRSQPGKNLWALPGGFVDAQESLEAALLRELAEETGLQLTPAEYTAYVRTHCLFDEPQRSVRGRTFSHAHLVQLPRSLPVPAVRGGDDAAAARWVALDALRPEHMFEDHYFIIQKLVREHLENHDCVEGVIQ